MKKSKYPEQSYCGKNFEHKRWGRHLEKCNICKNEYDKKINELRSEKEKKKKVCDCGCGIIIKNGGKFLPGHNLRTDKWKEIKRNNWIIDNPMFKEKNKKYGDENPSKNPESRRKISKNNPMKNDVYKKKCIENRKAVGYEKTKLLNKTLWNDKQLLEKRIKTYCDNLSNGKIKLKNNWVTGYYIRKDGTKEWYDSSYELKRMKYYDNNNIKWTKKHGIKIPYKNEKGINTFYVPDFLIEINNKKSIEEIKGWIKNNDEIKANHGIEYCKKNNMSYFFYLGENLELVTYLSYSNE